MDLRISTTGIPGLLVVRLPVHGDHRGWFKENWQREKMVGLGLPDFEPVQHSLAYNADPGTTRGIHAEPWDKLVSIAAGRIFGAWVDLREGDTHGVVHTEELDEAVAVFVPRGVGNSYQTLEPGTVYSYLVNDHWSPDADYTNVNLADPTLAVPWPIPLAQAVLSEKDRAHPALDAVLPVASPGMVILGGTGQLGIALRQQFPQARVVGRDECDLADPASIAALEVPRGGVLLNAAAYTAVDAAETPEGRRAAWAINAVAVSALARVATERRATLVHYSTDYVFDGTGGTGPEGAYREDDPVAPLGVYGQSKLAGDLAAATVPRHYVIRTSWVVGEGTNFIRTMQRLARSGASPAVVDDQVGRLTFTSELARATAHLLDTAAPFGTYNVTNGGDPCSWADLARIVFAHEGRDPGDVRPVSTQMYAEGQEGLVAPRPSRGVLDLARLVRTSFTPTRQFEAMARYLTDVGLRHGP